MTCPNSCFTQLMILAFRSKFLTPGLVNFVANSTRIDNKQCKNRRTSILKNWHLYFIDTEVPTGQLFLKVIGHTYHIVFLQSLPFCNGGGFGASRSGCTNTCTIRGPLSISTGTRRNRSHRAVISSRTDLHIRCDIARAVIP